MKLDLELVKKHLNVDDDYNDDDEYITHLANVSENAVLKDLDLASDADAYIDDEKTKYKPEIVQSMLLLIGTLYANRESETYGTANTLNHGYTYLNMLNRDYSYRG